MRRAMDQSEHLFKGWTIFASNHHLFFSNKITLLKSLRSKRYSHIKLAITQSKDYVLKVEID
jgi:hypothetical protein